MNNERETSPKKQKWEYMGVVTERVKDQWEPRVDMLELGNEEWELVSLLPMEYNVELRTSGAEAKKSWNDFEISSTGISGSLRCTKILYTLKRPKY